LKDDLRGIFLPITTPFQANENLDLNGLRSNIRKWNASGISGYVILGSTGERVHLDEREYLEVIETARQEVAPRPDGPVFIVGAGQESTRGTIAEIRRSAPGGADAALVITPHFYRSAITQDALHDHYVAVADASSIPVILYSNPALTGIKIAPETVARLSQHENIIGIKDSSTDTAGFEETVKLVSERFAVLTGNGTVFYEALGAGAGGAVLAVGCIAPHLCLEIFKAVKSEDKKRAFTLQEKLTPLARAVTTLYGIAGLKAALDMIGYVGGTSRAPLVAPDEQARAIIARILDDTRALMTGSMIDQMADQVAPDRKVVSHVVS
jgi:4-hydroxy-2-oxoglutarate aldolase